MASFCGFCGRQLADGEVCTCQVGTEAPKIPYPPLGAANETPNYGQSDPGYFPGADYGVNYTGAPSEGFFESMKNRMGIGSPELNAGNPYEEGMQIVPDCVSANEGEIPIRQYRVAKLRSRVLGIPYATAIGRIQVTNKRVIFRAPGKSIGGRTTLHHEFAIEELAGLEARREYVFNAFDLFLGFLFFAIGAAIGLRIVAGIYSDSPYLGFFISLLLGAAGCVPFFLMKKHWLLKLLCLGVGMMAMGGLGVFLFSMRHWITGGGILGVILIIFSLAELVCVVFALIFQSVRPNMVLVLKTAFASEAVDIRRRKITLRSSAREEHTGFLEVYPETDTERCIREVNAMINDLRKYGDSIVAKWKQG